MSNEPISRYDALIAREQWHYESGRKHGQKEAAAWVMEQAIDAFREGEDGRAVRLRMLSSFLRDRPIEPVENIDISLDEAFKVLMNPAPGLSPQEKIAVGGLIDFCRRHHLAESTGKTWLDETVHLARAALRALAARCPAEDAEFFGDFADESESES